MPARESVKEWLSKNNLDLQDRVQCDNVDCIRTAKFYVFHTCCKEIIITCPPCLKNAYKSLIVLDAQSLTMTCKFCHKQRSPKGFLSQPHLLDEPPVE